LGEISTRVQDMHPVWEDHKSRPRSEIAPEDTIIQVSTEIALPPAVVWDYLSIPEFRSTLMSSDSQRIEGRVGGRVTAGSTYVCFHGKRAVPQRITEWRPFEYLETVTVVRGSEVPVGLRLEATESGGTRLTEIVGKARGPLHARLVLNTFFRVTRRITRREVEAFKAHIEGDFAARGGPPTEVGVIPSADEIAAAVASSLGGD
jgi:uncharacterized protein YndB with AHSA1/START domain